MISEKEFLAIAKAQYDLLLQAEKAKQKIARTIEKVRAAGFKVIVVGNDVRVTIPKD